MDEQLNSYFKMAVESFDIGQEKRRFINGLEDIIYDYKLPMKEEDLRSVVDLIVNKIRDLYVTKMIEYKEKISFANTYMIKNDRPGILFSAIDDIPKINVESIVMGIYEDTLNRDFRNYAMRSPQFEYLPRKVKNDFIKFVDSVQEVIQLNVNIIKKHVEEIGFMNVKNKKSEENFVKSKRPMPTELLGINFDDEKKLFWAEADGKMIKLDLSKEKVVIDDSHYIEIYRSEDNQNMRISMFENGVESKSLFVDSKRVTYSSLRAIITNNLENNTLLVTEGFIPEEYDLDNMSYQDRKNLDDKLKKVDKNVLSYYERVAPKKSLDSLFL